MANLEESAVWTPGVYQLETTDPVLGGPVQPEPATGGIANRQALALANRTAYLKQTKADIASVALGYAPKHHTHPWTDITDPPEPATRWPTWNEIGDKPASFGAHVVSISALPTSDIGPVIVAEASEVWVWVSTPYYTGYRSPLCGRPVYGHTVVPLANEIDAVGGLVSKTSYARLWAYAQENSLVVSASDWTANIGGHWFVNVSNSQFRVPDLRNQFLRFTGTDADSANARAMGSRQSDAFQEHTHHGKAIAGLTNGGTYAVRAWDHPGGSANNDVVAPNGGAETRPVNVAYYPRIHA